MPIFIGDAAGFACAKAESDCCMSSGPKTIPLALSLRKDRLLWLVRRAARIVGAPLGNMHMRKAILSGSRVPGSAKWGIL